MTNMRENSSRAKSQANDRQLMEMLDAEARWISIAATLKRTVQAAQHRAQVLKRNSLIDLKAKDK
jgi:hypothetical protein